MKILLAGDDFIRNEILAREITARVTFQPNFTTLTLPWPSIPFGPVAEVEEASDCEDKVVESIGGVEVVVTQMAPLTGRVLARADSLRLIVCTRGGPVNVNTQAATARGIAVTCTPGRNAIAVAEYAVMLMLAAIRRLPEVHMSALGGRWRSDLYAYSACGTEIAGSVIGLIGFGEIGRRVADIVSAMGARVVVFDPFVSRASLSGETVLVSMNELLERANVISLHARLTADTRGIVGAAELAKVRPGTVLVNTARGALLDYGAAIRALEVGSLGALALDVFPEEPLPKDSPLLRMPGVVLSPHLAGATRETAERAAVAAALEVDRYARGQPLEHVVNGRDTKASQ